MTKKCPQCGAPLSEGALEGLCPACLLRQGASTETATQGEARHFEPPTVSEVARLFPQLEILNFIGKGGMGAVYKARQPSLDRIVALKILPPQVAGGPGFAERFTREARALAKLNHPNIVAVYEFGQVNEMPFFLMEFVDGLNLRELEIAGKLSPREALQIVPQICEALQFAHDEGVVHRDIKPENILLDKKGRVKIADFGIAKIMGAGNPEPGVEVRPAAAGGGAASGTEPARLTEEGKVMGTPNYMAPEQVETPESVDHRADIFSLGVVFYEMLTGELPLGKFAPPSSRTRGVTVDVRLDEVVLRALEKEPERRYQQASQVKTAVETIAGHPHASQALFQRQGFEYRSRATLFGLPLLHVATGSDPVTGRPRVARGILAIGGIAQGVVAFGGIAMGGLTFGGLSQGIVAFGGLAVGVVSIGGLAIALLLAFGGGAIAPIAIGGGAIGYFAYGGGVLGAHTFGANGSDEVARHFFMPWATHAMASVTAVITTLLVLMMTITLVVPLWLRQKMLLNASRPPAQPAGFPGMSRTGSAPTLLGIAAITFSSMAGVLGVIVICLLPQAPNLLVFSILASALLGFVLGIASRNTTLGRQAMIVGLSNIAIWLIIAIVYCYFWVASTQLIKSDYVGRTNFPWGDSIEIVSVERTKNWMTVKGRYTLVSASNALLALNITSTNEISPPEDPRQSTNLFKGSGNFELFHARLASGLPHVSMYGSDGQSFADLYFGTSDEALREGKAGDGLTLGDLPSSGSLAGCWEAEANANDSSSNGNHGTFRGGATYAGGKVGSAFAFDNYNTYVDVPDSPSLNPVNTITLTAWIYPNQLPEILGAPIIKKAGNNTWNQYGYSMEYDTAGNQAVRFGVYTGTGWMLSCDSAPTPLNTWTFLAGVYDGTNISMYMNGALMGTTPAGGTIIASPLDLQIGHDPNPADNVVTPRYFSGLIDEASVYSTALSPAQIRALYKLGNAGKLHFPSTKTDGAASSRLPRFGPVMERVVADSKDPNLTAGSNGSLLTNAPIMIDFDSGRLYAGPKEMWDSDTAAQKLWMQTNSVDALGVVPEVNGLVGLDMAAISVENGLWDTCSTVQALEQLSRVKAHDTFLFSAHGLSPSTWLFRTREGGAGILQITGFTENPGGVKIRYKLVQNPAGNRAKGSPVSSAALQEPPQLQFLAWQDEWKTNPANAARHPDGSPVTDATELKWLRHVQAPGMIDGKLNPASEPRYLYLWFSHPLFDLDSLNEVTLLNDKGAVIPPGAPRGSASGRQGANEYDDNLGWLTATLSLDPGKDAVHHITVQLRYTMGPLENVHELVVKPNHHTAMDLEGESQLNGLGQDVDGNAFVSIAVNADKMKGRKFGVLAVTRDGHEQISGGGRSGNIGGTGVGVEEIDFNVPLADVAKFRIGTRPIRTMEWKDVVLPSN
jgi:predicted Ser/Thr protein kinase